MSLLELFWPRQKPTALAAKQRLQILLTHERSTFAQPDYLQGLHRELLQVIARYVEIDEDKISFDFNDDKEGKVSRLGVNIELPDRERFRRALV